jgi:hypothetical protein
METIAALDIKLSLALKLFRGETATTPRREGPVNRAQRAGEAKDRYASRRAAESDRQGLLKGGDWLRRGAAGIARFRRGGWRLNEGCGDLTEQAELRLEDRNAFRRFTMQAAEGADSAVVVSPRLGRVPAHQKARLNQ